MNPKTISLVIVFVVLLFTLYSISYAQKQVPQYPTLEELENEHGYLDLNEEEIAEMEAAELEQLLVEQDTDGFVEALSEEYDEDEGEEGSILEIIRQFMAHFFQVMNQRPLYILPDSIPAQQLGFSTTFDIACENLQVKNLVPKIVIEFDISFKGLVQSYSNPEPLSGHVKIVYHKKNNRWKIKNSKGLFPFFIKCIQHIHPGDNLLDKFVILNEGKQLEGKYDERGGNNE